MAQIYKENKASKAGHQPAQMPHENLDLKVQPYYLSSSDHKILYGASSDTIPLCSLENVW